MKTKRYLSAILALLLLATLVLPAAGAPAPAPGIASGLIAKKAPVTADCMVYPLAKTINLGTTIGTSVDLSFKLNGPTPRKDDVLCIEIYGDDLNGELFDQRFYSVSKFDSNGRIDISWKPGEEYRQYQRYLVACLILTANDEIYEQAIFCSNLYINESKQRPTRMECGYINNYAYGGTVAVNETDTATLEPGETIALVPRFWPIGSRTSMPVSAAAADPNIAKVWMEDGYIMVKGLVRGSTKINIECDWYKATFSVIFGEMVDFRLAAGKTDLCVGATDQITTSLYKPGDPIYYAWETSDPSVATVKDGLVTTLKPGKVIISATAYSNTHSVRYTVNYHKLPEDTPVTGPTATQPKQAVGRCSVCGKDDAVNIFEPAIFTDTSAKSWYAKHVDKVYDLGLMNGVGEHTFAPNANVTRAMAATVLYRIAGKPKVEGESSFTDVVPGKYYSKAVIWAQAQDIVTGYPDGTFRPDENITREQLAAILYRYAKATGSDVSSGTDLGAFPDAEKVHSYAKKALGWAVGEKLITGVGVDGTTFLQPTDNATRAQFATIISRYLAAIKPETLPEEE